MSRMATQPEYPGLRRAAIYVPLGTLIWAFCAILVAGDDWTVFGPSVAAGIISGALAAFVLSS